MKRVYFLLRLETTLAVALESIIHVSIRTPHYKPIRQGSTHQHFFWCAGLVRNQLNTSQQKDATLLQQTKQSIEDLI